jgi:hypothetical protein
MLTISEIELIGSSKQIKVFKCYKVKPNHSRHNVLNGKTLKTQIGRITFKTGNEFCYYEPPTNTSKAVLVDEVLEDLIKKIANRRNC